MRLLTAFQAFFAVLFNRVKAEQIVPVLKDEPLPVLVTEKQPETTSHQSPQRKQGYVQPDMNPNKREQKQSEAITLLATLQREARLIDFLMENLDGYDDAQVGAAARTVHDNCVAVVARLFDVQPLRTEDEMSQITVATTESCSSGINASFVHLVGNVSGNPPYTGRLTHRGWVAKQCELPTWTGTPEAAFVLAPAEVEIG